MRGRAYQRTWECGCSGLIGHGHDDGGLLGAGFADAGAVITITRSGLCAEEGVGHIVVRPLRRTRTRGLRNGGREWGADCEGVSGV
jgi:hypothetical protein